MFLFKIFKYFKLVNSLKDKRESIKNWRKIVVEKQSDESIYKTVKSILKIDSSEIDMTFDIKLCYSKHVKRFLKYPIIHGSFKVGKYLVKFEVFNHLTKNYKLEYTVFENGVSKFFGMGDIDEYFKKLAMELNS